MEYIVDVSKMGKKAVRKWVVRAFKWLNKKGSDETEKKA